MTNAEILDDFRKFEREEFFVLRTPLLPFSEFERWGEGLEAPRSEGDRLEMALHEDRQCLRQRLRRWVEDPVVREAILVASPDLEESIPVWVDQPDGDRGRRIERALARYFTRMSTRATPFGLFAGNSMGRASDQTRLLLSGRTADRQHVRLDMDYLYALAKALSRDPLLRRNLILEPNSSLYRAAGRIRYVESRLEGRNRTHHLVAIVPTAHLESTLARAAEGATPDALAQPLVDEEISAEEASSFVDALVESQVLVSKLEPKVTGDEQLRDQSRVLREEMGAETLAENLDRIQDSLDQLNAVPPGDSIELYRQASDQLGRLPIKTDLPYLFHVDLTRASPVASLGGEVAAEIARGVDLLRRLRSRDPSTALRRFREAFLDRYETREVPLLLALDEEAGIGFDPADELQADSTPILHGLAFPETPSEGRGARDGRLARLLRQSGQGIPLTGIQLTEDDIGMLASRDPEPLPDAFAALATVAARSEAALDAGRFQVFVEYVAGPSGARLLGRFCHADPILRAAVEEHLRAEERLRPDSVFAEVVHLPEGRLGNVLCRPVLRSHEIVFFGRSGAAAGQRISPEDLFLSVVGDRVVLRSRALGCEIHPRLTSAHNYSWRSMGIYRFLCSLQDQGSVPGLSWDWGTLDEAPYLSRVTAGRIVLSLARWRMSSTELKPIADATGADLFRMVRNWRQIHGIGRLAVLADNDNRLVVDFENVISLESFLQLVVHREEFILKELFPGPDQLVARGPEGHFVSEIVVPFIRTQTPSPSETQPIAPILSREGAPQVSRCFPPASEWLFAKLYTGRMTADLVLREVVRPLLLSLGGEVTNWFFIRYSDPQPHLRLRLRGTPRFLMDEAARYLASLVEPFLSDGCIWRLTLDTYQREVERYGGPEGIELSERLFHVDSDCVLSIVDTLEGDPGLDARWRIALRGVDLMLDDIGFDPMQKLSLLRRARGGLARELGVDRDFERRLDRRFREDRSAVERLFDPAWERDGDLSPGFTLLRERSLLMQPIVSQITALAANGRLTTSLENLAASYAHMHCNRLLRSAHRAQEFVIYDFLERLSESRIARAGRVPR
jgi:thiopeptide-type bacteriocin biosynthesis protein